MAQFRRNGKFGKALGKAMKSAKMTRAAVAAHADVHRTTVQGWLNGSEPGDDNFRKLVALFPELAKFES